MDVVKQSDAKMNQMRQFLATLVVIWTAACIAAYFYSQEQNIPGAVALAVVPAFLLELGLYLVPRPPGRIDTAFDSVSQRADAG